MNGEARVALRKLLTVAFDAADLRMFVRDHYPEQADRLPLGASLENQADALIGQLHRFGLLDAMVLYRIRDRRAMRAGDVAAVAGLTGLRLPRKTEEEKLVARVRERFERVEELLAALPDLHPGTRSGADPGPFAHAVRAAHAQRRLAAVIELLRERGENPSTLAALAASYGVGEDLSEATQLAPDILRSEVRARIAGLGVSAASLRQSASDDPELGLAAELLAAVEGEQRLTTLALAGLERLVARKMRPSFDVFANALQLPDDPRWVVARDHHATLHAVSRAVVRLRLETTEPVLGTGALVAPDVILTGGGIASHAVDGRGRHGLILRARFVAIFGTARGAVEREVELEPILVHPYWDVALFRASERVDDVAPLTLAPAEPRPLAGRDAVVIGHRGGSHARYGVGVVRGYEATVRANATVQALEHDCCPLGTDAGSPLVDPASGVVLGVCREATTRGTGLATPLWPLIIDDKFRAPGVRFAELDAAPSWITAWDEVEPDDGPDTVPPPRPSTLEVDPRVVDGMRALERDGELDAHPEPSVLEAWSRRPTDPNDAWAPADYGLVRSYVERRSRPVLKVVGEALEPPAPYPFAEWGERVGDLARLARSVGRIHGGDGAPLHATAFLVDPRTCIVFLGGLSPRGLKLTFDLGPHPSTFELGHLVQRHVSGVARVSLGAAVSNLDPLPLSEGAPAAGTDVALLAYHGDAGVLAPCVSPGRLVRLTPSGVQHDCNSGGGTAGGPLIDVERGQVIGVHFAAQRLPLQEGGVTELGAATPSWELLGDRSYLAPEQQMEVPDLGYMRRASKWRKG